MFIYSSTTVYKYYRLNKEVLRLFFVYKNDLYQNIKKMSKCGK